MSGKDPELDKWDQWIDQALEDYAAPRDEDTSRRIAAGTMRHIEGWRNRRRRILFFELAGAFAVASALLVVFLLQWLGKVEPPPLVQIANVRPPEPSISAPAPLQPKPVLAPRNLNRSARKEPAVETALPKLDQFPAPARLSAEEQAIVSLAGSGHAEALKPQTNAPLQISPIEIVALQVTPLDANK